MNTRAQHVDEDRINAEYDRDDDRRKIRSASMKAQRVRRDTRGKPRREG